MKLKMIFGEWSPPIRTNPALHLALGTMLRQQQRYDDAYDELTAALKLMPELPENHSALFLSLSTIWTMVPMPSGGADCAEHRSQESEAYQFLVLGHYSLGQYLAAIHATGEALPARPRQSLIPTTTLGIALDAEGIFPAAVTAYQRAIQLRPAFWEAHSI